MGFNSGFKGLKAGKKKRSKAFKNWKKNV